MNSMFVVSAFTRYFFLLQTVGNVFITLVVNLTISVNEIYSKAGKLSWVL